MQQWCRFEADPTLQSLDAAKQQRAKDSFEAQLKQQLEEALRPWEDQMQRVMEVQKQQGLARCYEVRATRMAKCHRACEAPQGEGTMTCIRKAIESNDLLGSEACFKS